jgi:hypothetical protein
MFTLYSRDTYVQNIGFDGTGTHNNEYFDEYNSKFGNKLYLLKKRIEIKESQEAKKGFELFFIKIKKRKIIIILKRILKFFYIR